MVVIVNSVAMTKFICLVISAGCEREYQPAAGMAWWMHYIRLFRHLAYKRSGASLESLWVLLSLQRGHIGQLLERIISFLDIFHNSLNRQRLRLYMDCKRWRLYEMFCLYVKPARGPMRYYRITYQLKSAICSRVIAIPLQDLFLSNLDRQQT